MNNNKSKMVSTAFDSFYNLQHIVGRGCGLIAVIRITRNRLASK